MPALQLEARRSARSSCQTWPEAHHAVLQDEAPWYFATSRPFTGVSRKSECTSVPTRLHSFMRATARLCLFLRGVHDSPKSNLALGERKSRCNLHLHHHADAWRLTAGRANYLSSELRRHELQRAERTLACKTQSLGSCVAPSSCQPFSALAARLTPKPAEHLGSFQKDLQPYFLTAAQGERLKKSLLRRRSGQ